MLYGPRKVNGEDLLTLYGTLQGLQVLTLNLILALKDLAAYVFNELPVDHVVVLVLHPADYFGENLFTFSIHFNILKRELNHLR